MPSKTKTTRKPGRPRRFTVEQIADALRACYGNRSQTAKRLGASRSTINAYVEAAPELKAVVAEGRETILDLAEAAIVRAIKRGDWRPAAFTLRTLGRARGFNFGITVTPPPLLPTRDLKSLSAAEIKTEIDQLAAMESKLDRGEELTTAELAALAAGAMH